MYTVVTENTFFSPECVIPNTLRMGQKKQFSYDIYPTSKCNHSLFLHLKDSAFVGDYKMLHKEKDLGSSESYLRGAAPPHGGTAEVWGDGRCGFLSRQSVTQIGTFFVLFFPFFQTSKVL